jgi:hypothetical protein
LREIVENYDSNKNKNFKKLYLKRWKQIKDESVHSKKVLKKFKE